MAPGPPCRTTSGAGPSAARWPLAVDPVPRPGVVERSRSPRWSCPAPVSRGRRSRGRGRWRPCPCAPRGRTRARHPSGQRRRGEHEVDPHALLRREAQPLVVPVRVHAWPRCNGRATSVYPASTTAWKAARSGADTCVDVLEDGHRPHVLVRGAMFQSPTSAIWASRRRPARPHRPRAAGPTSRACSPGAGRPARGRSARTGSTPARRRRSRRSPVPPPRAARPSPGCPGKPTWTSSSPTRDTTATPFHCDVPYVRDLVPEGHEAIGRGTGRPDTSSPAWRARRRRPRSTQSTTRSTRARMEFTFQVAIRTSENLPGGADGRVGVHDTHS